MLELRSDLIADVNQVPSVNCQLIVRSELLELPCIELLARMRDEAEENPALEMEFDPSIEVPTVAPEYSSRGRWRDGSSDPTMRAASEHDLRDELHRRIGWAVDEHRREIAAWLIECIDERGYLSASTLEAALELQVEPAEVEEVVRSIQALAPPGVGARNLRECLQLQLDELPDVPDYVRTVVAHCDRALERGGWPALCDELGLTRTQSREALRIIRANLTPYPGEQFRPHWQHLLPDNSQATQPDVVLSIQGDEIEVALTTSQSLSVRVADAYRRLDERMRRNRSRAEDDATTRARAQVRSARQLIWSLQQRERSLYRISRAIVSEQREFILQGPLAHRALTHKRISELTGLHESTVSRATMGKLVQMPSGDSVPFTVFFDDALPAKTVLRSILAGESAKSPLTDEQLQTALREEGYALARRTVNKYRRALGIPSSTERRRIYAAA
ncbi:MAG: RNA polymerase factor sigma-54 [Armatimonadia bacterium]|nr:RNA polymerase factor sigma-54 [Armatimonadia bacterium]